MVLMLPLWTLGHQFREVQEEFWVLLSRPGTVLCGLRGFPLHPPPREGAVGPRQGKGQVHRAALRLEILLSLDALGIRQATWAPLQYCGT